MKESLTWLRLLILSLIVGLPAMPATLQASPLDDLLHDIETHSRRIETLRCRFTQERSLAMFQQPIRFHGRLALIRPDRLRWEFLSPVPSVLIFNGDRGLRCTDGSDPVEFNLATDPVMRMVAEQLWTWLKGDYAALRQSYAIKQSGPAAITVTPVDQGTADIIAAIDITFDDATFQPQSVTILEAGGDSTRIDFSDYAFDTRLPEAMFTSCLPREE